MTRLSGLRNVVAALGYTVLFGVLVVVLGPLLSGGAKADNVMGQVSPALVMGSLSFVLPALLVGVLVGRLGSLGGGLPGLLGLGVLMGLVPVVLSFAVLHSYPHLPGVGWQTYALSGGIVACCVVGGVLGRWLRRRHDPQPANGGVAPAG